MAREFKYKLSLDLTHFSIDPQEISGRIKHLAPYSIRAGDLNPRRKRLPANSVWMAQLHEAEFLHSTTHEFGATIREYLEPLQPFSDIFHEVRKTGYAYLQVVWFSDTNHSVGIIPADVLQLCGSMGLDIDLEYYSPDVPAAAASG